MAELVSNDTIDVNDCSIYYEIYGDGEPILLLHGFTGSGKEMVDIFSSLAETNKLIVPDLRGHGRSTNPKKLFSHTAAAEDVESLLNILEINKCKAVGFSAGANILLHLAFNKKCNINTMIIVSGAPYFPPKARLIMQQFSMDDKSDEDWESMRKIHHHGDEQIKALWHQAHFFKDSYTDMNFQEEDLNTIDAKTLIIHGEFDPFYDISIAEEMKSSIPHSELAIVPDGSHVPVSEVRVKQMIEFLNNN